MLTVKKYKLLIYYFWGVKLEKLTNSVSYKKKPFGKTVGVRDWAKSPREESVHKI